jgi:hypothetical protein
MTSCIGPAGRRACGLILFIGSEAGRPCAGLITAESPFRSAVRRANAHVPTLLTRRQAIEIGIANNHQRAPAVCCLQSCSASSRMFRTCCESGRLSCAASLASRSRKPASIRIETDVRARCIDAVVVMRCLRRTHRPRRRRPGQRTGPQAIKCCARSGAAQLASQCYVAPERGQRTTPAVEPTTRPRRRSGI